MRHTRKLLFAVVAVTLTAGPVLAAPVSLTAQPTLTAPTSASPGNGGAWLKLLGGVAVFGSIANMKDPGTLAKKFVTRAGNAQPDYQAGVATAGQVWEAHAGNSETAWEQGVQNAVTKKRFASGVQGKGGKYQQNASTLGPNRYTQGVQNAGDAWARGVAQSFATLKGLSLPPRGYRGAPANQQRAAAVATALAALRANK
jgi:hypothetical protein